MAIDATAADVTEADATEAVDLKPVDPRALKVSRGDPAPLGAQPSRHGVNFAIVCPRAKAVTLILADSVDAEPAAAVELDARGHRTGQVWHCFVSGIGAGVHYAWRVDNRPVAPGTQSPAATGGDPLRELIDPYAKAISVTAGDSSIDFVPGTGEKFRKRRGVVVCDDFDWGDDQPPGHHMADSVIYELHVRGFTKSESAGVEHPGTYLGLLEKIPYLTDLGVTAVELLPVAVFEELDNNYVNPQTKEPLRNFWGYNPINFFAPHVGYAHDKTASAAVREFKTMVKALHAAGIEVILDVVFNHTGEGNRHGPAVSFRGIDPATYYILDGDAGVRASYANYTGCGNTVNCNHPVVQDLIVAALRYWVIEMHVDGFRFDLASILARGRRGEVLASPPIVERIAADPVLAETKLIAEAWDAAGLYQVGSFPHWGRWAEWNGRYRDDIRRFVKGDSGMVPALATRLAGSSDLYHAGRHPFHSINYVTSHDGFTLADLFSYNERHNEANGERNRDGHSATYSWNCGVEGPAEDAEIQRLRGRQRKNAMALLLCSQGVPMMLAGDEMARTQGGNNNAYCQDNDISWVNWDLLRENADLHRFVRLLIRFRRANATLRRRTFFPRGDEHATEVEWHGIRGRRPDWSGRWHALAMLLFGGSDAQDIYLIANADSSPHRFVLPRPSQARAWYRFVDTALAPPEEITELGAEVLLPRPAGYDVKPRSIVILVGK